MFIILRFHIEEGCYDLHVTVLQVLYDNAVKVGVKLKPSTFFGDERFCMPERSSNDTKSRWGSIYVPSNVILKIPNEYIT